MQEGRLEVGISRWRVFVGGVSPAVVVTITALALGVGAEEVAPLLIGLAVFTVLAGLVALDIGRFRTEISQTGIVLATRGDPTFVPWTAITEVTYSRLRRRIVIRTGSRTLRCTAPLPSFTPRFRQQRRAMLALSSHYLSEQLRSDPHRATQPH